MCEIQLSMHMLFFFVIFFTLSLRYCKANNLVTKQFVCVISVVHFFSFLWNKEIFWRYSFVRLFFVCVVTVRPSRTVHVGVCVCMWKKGTKGFIISEAIQS